MTTWKPRDFMVAVLFVALGFALSSVLPDELWKGIGATGFIASLWWSARQNRRREQSRAVPPEWAPGKPPSPN
jgi:hypothetical protein